MINPTEFQRSIGNELQAVKNRVRNLIGAANWAEEGRYKEDILRNVITKYLPKNLTAATGFIIRHEELEDRPKVSKQIDILIYDNSYPVLFSEGNLVMVTERSVRGIIEVKSKIYRAAGNNNSLQSILEKFNFLCDFPYLADRRNLKVFKGVFSYEYEGNVHDDGIDEALLLSNGLVNHISLDASIFIKYWLDKTGLIPEVQCDLDFYNIYKLKNLSHAYFISNLIHTVTDHDLRDRYWVSFPIEETKEARRVRSVCLNNGV